jgi:thiamine biosynthesis protein ThiI
MKKFISLISGGLDSPIASYLMIKKGFIPIFISFLTSDDLDHTLKLKVCKVVSELSKFTNYKVKLFLINHDPNLDKFINLCDRKLTCILCKRLMLRIAKHIGNLENANIIVTGDIMGEQASQTLDNLFAYQNVVKDFIILRPLIGLNKNDIINLNRDLELYETTSSQSASCRYNPQYPETHAKSHEIILSESNLEIKSLIDNSINSAETLEF